MESVTDFISVRSTISHIYSLTYVKIEYKSVDSEGKFKLSDECTQYKNATSMGHNYYTKLSYLMELKERSNQRS